METRVLLILKEGQTTIAKDITELDRAVEQLIAGGAQRSDQAVACILRERDRLQAQYDELNRSIVRVQLSIDGRRPEGDRVVN